MHFFMSIENALFLPQLYLFWWLSLNSLMFSLRSTWINQLYLLLPNICKVESPLSNPHWQPLHGLIFACLFSNWCCCCWSSGCGGLGPRHFPADTRVCFFTLTNFAMSDNCWLFFPSKLYLVFLLSWLLIFCLIFVSSQSVVSLCVFNEMDVLLPVTEDGILLHFRAKPFFFLLLDGLPKPARELTFIGSAFLQAWSTRSLTLLKYWDVASQSLQAEYSL